MKITRLTRVGNSLGVVVPTDTLREIGWWQGDTIKQSVVDGKLVLQNLTQHNIQRVHEHAEFGDAKHKRT